MAGVESGRENSETLVLAEAKNIAGETIKLNDRVPMKGVRWFTERMPMPEEELDKTYGTIQKIESRGGVVTVTIGQICDFKIMPKGLSVFSIPIEFKLNDIRLSR